MGQEGQGCRMADQAGGAHRRDQERTLRPRRLEVEPGRAERTAWQALGAEVEALLGRVQGRSGRNRSARHSSDKGTRAGSRSSCCPVNSARCNTTTAAWKPIAGYGL
jgi:hypothetical protein